MTVTKENSDPKASAKWHQVRQEIKGEDPKMFEGFSNSLLSNKADYWDCR